MKKTIITITFLLVYCFSYSQDIITTRTGDQIQSRVLEISPIEIRYINPENPDGPVYVIYRSDVQMIRYQSGYEEIFEAEPVIDTVNYYRAGLIDASKYYRGYKAAGTGTLLTSLLVSPLVGLVPAIACSSTKPAENSLNYPDKNLYSVDDYKRGYNYKAKKMKSGKVWNNWAIALMINVVAFAALAR